MKALIYGRPGCTFCDRAKILCKLKGIEFEYKSITTDEERSQLAEQIGRPVESVPQIFITEDGFSEYVGGYTQLEAKLNG